MIAVTDISAITDLETAPEAVNIGLTSAVINQYISGSVIINASITSAVKSLLSSIVDSTATLQIFETISKIASYSGFTAANDGNTSFNASLVSLDKLTFYVIFRLPAASSNLNYEDPLPESSVIPVSTSKKWGKYANYIRGLNGSGLKKINSAGEQVNSDNKPVNDSNDIIEGWYNENAYNYLGEHPFNSAVNVPPGLYPVQTEKAMLFEQNTNQPNGPGELPLEITKIPLYFYLLAKVENPYNSTFWLNPSKDSITISRVPHWPAKVIGQDPRKHFVKLTANPVNITVDDGAYKLSNDSGGTYFSIIQGNATQKFYISALDSASLIFENLSLATASKVEKNGEGFLAIWETKYNAPPLSNNSGLTVGMGVDIGAGLSGLFRIEMVMTIAGNTSGGFRLYCCGRRTDVINAAVTEAKVRTLISNLIECDSSRVTVKRTPNTNIFSIKILREYSSNNKAYNHRIYAADLTGGVTVSLTPQNESDRWVEQQDALNDSFYYLTQILNYSFSNTPAGNDFWLTQIGSLTNTEQNLLKLILKKSSGCRSKSGYYLWDENKALIKKIEIKSYVQNLRAVYYHTFIPKYYEKKRTIATGALRNNANNTTVKHLLENPRLKSTPNQAELFAIVLLNYNFPSLYRARIGKLIDAINAHSVTKLNDAIKGLSKDRLTALSNFLGSTVKAKLYHGIED